MLLNRLVKREKDPPPCIVETHAHLLNPNLVAYLTDKSIAETYSHGSNKKASVSHLTDDGTVHTWTAVISQITKGTRCPYCYGKKVLRGFNDVATACPELLEPNSRVYFLNREDAFIYRKSSNKKVVFAHQNDDGSLHTWVAQIKSVTATKGTACPYCSGQKVLCRFNDITTTNSELMIENT